MTGKFSTSKVITFIPRLIILSSFVKMATMKCEEDFPNISLNWFFVSVKKIFLWKPSPHMVVGLSASSYPSPLARTVVEKTRLSYLFWSTKFLEIYIISSYKCNPLNNLYILTNRPVNNYGHLATTVHWFLFCLSLLTNFRLKVWGVWRCPPVRCLSVLTLSVSLINQKDSVNYSYHTAKPGRALSFYWDQNLIFEAGKTLLLF